MRSRIGLDLIEWTFDPLQALNAHFNFARLGVVVEEYEQDMYGQTGSPLHFGTPTDRFVAEWRLTAPHVERRVSPGGAALIRDQSVMSAAAVNQCHARGEWLAPSMPSARFGDQAPDGGDPDRLYGHAITPARSGDGVEAGHTVDLSDLPAARIQGGGFLPGAGSAARAIPAGAENND